MNIDARKLMNEYVREWRKNNKEKVKEYNRKTWEKKAARLKEEQKEKNI